MGGKFARQPNNSKEEHISFGQMVILCCYYTIKCDAKVNIHAREQLLVLNLITSRQITKRKVVLNKLKLWIILFINALNT